jgi:hypothetical protein
LQRRTEAGFARVGLTQLRTEALWFHGRKPPPRQKKAGWGTLLCKFLLINKLTGWATRRVLEQGTLKVILVKQIGYLGHVALWPATSDWEPFGFMFPGLAQSAVFDVNNAEVAVVTMGGAMVIPEPTTALLFLSGLGTVVTLRRRG